ncbi:MAG TPA: hypothetical protein VI140_02655 [Oxalicibacterium sp.]
MKKIFGISAGILAGALLLSAAPAMARVNVDVHLGVPVYAGPAPVYVAPHPVYVAPRPMPVYVHPRRHYHHKRYIRPRGDYDRDGVPNRFDRRPTNPYRY